MSLQQDRIVGVLLLAFSIWYGITTRAYTVGWFLLYALTFNWVGVVRASAGGVTLLTQIFEGPLLRSVVASLVFSLVMYGLFAGLLELSLPTGQLIQQMLGRT